MFDWLLPAHTIYVQYYHLPAIKLHNVTMTIIRLIFQTVSGKSPDMPYRTNKNYKGLFL